MTRWWSSRRRNCRSSKDDQKKRAERRRDHAQARAKRRRLNKRYRVTIARCVDVAGTVSRTKKRTVRVYVQHQKLKVRGRSAR